MYLAAMRLRLNSMGYGPDAVGRLDDGRVVFVRGGAPGDVVDIEVTNSHSRHLEARIVSLVEASDHRREPACEHHRSEECGGCPWQHLSDDCQQAEKQAIVVREVGRIAKQITVRPMLVPGPPLGYRRRTRLGHNGDRLGYRYRGQQRIFDIRMCPVLQPELEAELDTIRDAVKEWRSGNVDVMVDESGDVIVGGPANAFAQPNRHAEKALIDLVLEAVPIQAKTVVELFCGAGTFTVPLLERGHGVSAWEVDKQSLAKLIEKAPDAMVHRADLFKGPHVFGHPDAIVLDPPRKGASACMQSIIDSQPDTVCYVSCDVMTLCRDISVLVSGGYIVEWVQPVDAFPQTHHIECVARLTKETP